MRWIVLLGLCLGLVLGALPAAEPVAPTEAAAESAYNEKVLRNSGIDPAGPGLVSFFRSHVLHPDHLQRLKTAITDLGDDSFETREKASRSLIQAGRFSLPLLRSVLNDEDPERAVRATQALETIELFPHVTLVTAAAQLAGQRRPAGATEAMLACLPWIEEESAREALHAALLSTGQEGGKCVAAVLEATKDREPFRRAAAGFVLGQGNTDDQQLALRLLQDPDTQVRFYASRSLILMGEMRAIPVLIAQLTDAPLSLAWQAEDVLSRVAGDKMPVSNGNWERAGRLRCREGWEQWWKTNGSTLVLKPNSLKETYLGLNVVVELDGSTRSGRIWECGSDGKVRWEITNVSRPIDAQILPGERVLVAEHGQSRVTERDRKGQILWEHRLQSQPVAVKRLPNGNTFIVTYQEILEVAPSNKVVYSHPRPGMIYYGAKLRNGNIVYITSNNQVVEMDEAGKELKTIPVGNTGGWASVEKLSSGRYLVALYGSRKVVEVDESGKVIWEASIESPGHATRLANGNTLVACIEAKKVVELNRASRVVWEQPTVGRPFHIYRR